MDENSIPSSSEAEHNQASDQTASVHIPVLPARRLVTLGELLLLCTSVNCTSEEGDVGPHGTGEITALQSVGESRGVTQRWLVVFETLSPSSEV